MAMRKNALLFEKSVWAIVDARAKSGLDSLPIGKAG